MKVFSQQLDPIKIQLLSQEILSQYLVSSCAMSESISHRNIEVVYIIANSNCMTLGLKFWVKKMLI